MVKLMKTSLFVVLFASFVTLPLALGADAPKKEPMVKGGLAKEVIDENIKKNIGPIQSCYVKEISSSKKPMDGRLGVFFLINKDGKVEKAGIESSTFMNIKLEDCVLAAIKAISFPKPTNGAKVEVFYPFSFAQAVEKK